MDKKKVLLDAAKDIVAHRHYYSCNAIYNHQPWTNSDTDKHYRLRNAYCKFFDIDPCAAAPFAPDDSNRILIRSLMLLLYRESL